MEARGFSLLQKLADLTLAEVEDLVPVLAPVKAPIFGPIGTLRYRTIPICGGAGANSVYRQLLHGEPLMCYEYAARDLLSSDVPQAQTTIKTE